MSTNAAIPNGSQTNIGWIIWSSGAGKSFWNHNNTFHKEAKKEKKSKKDKKERKERKVVREEGEII